MKYINKILNSGKSVFTFSDIKLLLWINNRDTIKSFLLRQIKSWFFQKTYKWIYVMNDFDIFEFASKLKKISYISFETVLKQEGIVFQDYWNTIFSSSDNTITKRAIWLEFKYCKIKNTILLNPLWLINKWNYTIATPERAICDRLYLSKNYYFDNLEWINKEKLIEISQIYNKRVILEVKKILENVK